MDSSHITAFSFTPFILAGFSNGISPWALVVLIIFNAFLYAGFLKRRQVILAGVVFITAVSAVSFAWTLGVFDAWRGHDFLDIAFNFVYFFFYGLLVILGITNLYDWRICRRAANPADLKIRPWGMFKKDDDSAGRQIPAAAKGEKDIIAAWLKIILAALLSGFAASSFEMIAIRQSYMTTVFDVFWASGFEAKSVAILLLYELAFIAPLVLVFAAFLFLADNKKFIAVVHKHITKIKIVNSAVYFGFGIGLLLI